MRERLEFGDQVKNALAADSLHYDPGTLFIRHFLDVLINDIGLETIKSKVVCPPEGVGIVEAPRGTLAHYYVTDGRRCVDEGESHRLGID